MPEDFWSKVRYLCTAISNVEWSGVLFYKFDGSITDETLSVTLLDILLMDKGSSAYTDYEFNSAFTEYMMNHPEYMEDNYAYGHIHSHNKMDVFFSGTDNQELVDNAENYNFYLSVIVNNAGKITGKVAQYVREKGIMETSYFDTQGEFKGQREIDRSFIRTVDCVFEIENEINVPQSFKDRTLEVIKEAEARKPVYKGPSYPSAYQYPHFGSQTQIGFDEETSIIDLADAESMVDVKYKNEKRVDKVIAKWLLNDLDTKMNGVAALNRLCTADVNEYSGSLLLAQLQNFIREEFRDYDAIAEVYVLLLFQDNYLSVVDNNSADLINLAVEDRINSLETLITWQL